MKLLAGTWYLELSELEAAGISANTVKSGLHRSSSVWVAIKDPTDARRLLISFDSMAPKYKNQVKKQFGPVAGWGSASAVILDAPAESLALMVTAEPKHYEHFLLQMPPDEAMAYARAAAWLTLASSATKAVISELGFSSKEQFHEAILTNLREEALPPLRISNRRVLQRKLSEFKSQGISCLHHGNSGNANAAKLECEEQRKTLVALMGDSTKPPINVVAYLYNKQAVKNGWPQISESTARNYLYQPDVRRVWTMSRHGVAVWRNQFDFNLRRSKPSAPDVLWDVDGTPLELYYKKTKDVWNKTANRWETRTTYHNRLEGIIVIDAYSWRILGGILAESETATSVKDALKEAVQSSMRLPLELRHDNSSAIKANKWLFDQLATYNTSTRPYNGKSKIIENVLGHWQSMVLRYYPNWAGMGVRTRREDNHANMEVLMQRKDQVPELAELQRQFQESLMLWNQLETEGRRAPNELYSHNSAGRPVEMISIISMFFEMRKHFYTYRPDGLSIDINGKRHVFQVPELAFHKANVGQRFQVAYDTDALEYIYLYRDGRPVLDESGQPLMAVAANLVPMSRADYNPGDDRKLGRLLKVKDNVEADTALEVADLRKFAAENDLKIGPEFLVKSDFNQAESALKSWGEDDWNNRIEKMYQ